MSYDDYLKYLDFAPQRILEAGVGRPEQCRTKRFWPEGIPCHLFEPHPDQFAALDQAARHYPNVKLFPVALWDYEGEITLYQFDSASWVKGVIPRRRDLQNREKFKQKRAIPVSCAPLSSYDNGHYDLALIDVEAAEWKVLSHMTSRPKLIGLEMWKPKSPKYKHPDYDLIMKWMDKNGYEQVGTEGPDSYFVRELQS